MTARRLPPNLAAIGAAVFLAVFGAPRANAGLFDDDEARQQIVDLANKVNERVDTLSKAQIELMNQIQSLRDENAKLQGEAEMLRYELESAKKRQQDFYVDLDGRLRRFEMPPDADAILSEGAEPTAASPAAPANPAAEASEYESALNLFKANKIKESAAAFGAFAKAYPDGALAPNAHYWQANALAALRDCKRAIDVYRVVVAKWPQNLRAADALVGMASCQQELGEAKSARATLETVLAKYPDSPAAATARQRLKR